MGIRLALRCAAVVIGLATATPLAAQSVPAAAAPSPLSVGGTLYTQFLYQVLDTAHHANRFEVTRAYVNVLGKFTGGLSARMTADIFTNTDSSRVYRVKYAYLAYQPAGSPLTFKMGEIHTPWLDFEETLWDYRMQGQMAMERGGYLSSSDFGVGVDGKWNADQVNMQFAVIDGESYNRGTGDQRKDAAGRVSVRLLNTSDASRVGGLRLTGYGQYGKPTGGGIRWRTIGMLSYRSSNVTLAAEMAYTRDTSATTGAQARGRLASGFGVIRFPRSRAALIGRIDVTDPEIHAGTDRLIRVIGGFSWQVQPNWRVLAGWDHLIYHLVPTPAQEATRSQALFQSQVTF